MRPAWRNRLDRIFGTQDWIRTFYQTQTQPTLFGEEQQTKKVSDSISAIVGFYQERLKSIFARVAGNPAFLCNSKNSPMFIFTFAMSNPSKKAQELALTIAEHILGKRR